MIQKKYFSSIQKNNTSENNQKQTDEEHFSQTAF